MPKSLSSARARQELVDRLERLTPDAIPLWGRMTAPQMLAHLADWMLMAKGELNTAAKKRVLRIPPLKQLVIYWLPFPKGVPTAPELISRKPSEWAIERATVRQHIQWFEDLDAKAVWPEHPAFGRMTPRAWCVLGYRHTDHHLRQFGI
ncbi:MAG: DinB family protein [Gemmatimonadota bacterium]|nr:DinB family protein [Gemmatimonadota bacterium]